jgi:alkanesulfonate monooxygenase SsuD/methylene tetrahydromethanopterin reductase-like flavin-dependent oxidoreductase (luciferase family)
MKLMSFHLMPYTKLPQDFAEKHGSVWVDIDPKLFDANEASVMYNDFIDELESAAELGFDAVCVNEHHSNGYGLMPSPNLVASALARNTDNAAICLLGNSLALYNPPIRVAEEVAMLDCISGGRVIAGFPVGTPMDTCFAYGQNPSTLRDRYNEAHDLIVRAWKADEPFPFRGRFTDLRYVNPWPRPVQKPHPPIWVPGGGSVETWEWCARMDYVFCYLSYFGYQFARSAVSEFWSYMDKIGKDRNPYQTGFLQFVGVAETTEEAWELYREPAEYFYGRSLRISPRYVDPPGYMTEGSRRAKAASAVASAAKIAGKGGVSTEFDQIVANGFVIIGNPDEVAEQLREAVLELNVGHLMVLLQFGNMKHDVALENTRLFAERVSPQLRDMFDDRWEDRWWPQNATRVPFPSARAR